MDFFDVIKNRVSVRDYDPKRPVDNVTLYKILDAGRIAPSASNRQPWKFIIIHSSDMLSKVRKCYGRDWFKDAPHILVVVGDKNKSWTRSIDSYNSLETDLTIAMDHMILAAEALGVGTCWIAAFDNTILRNALQLNENEIVYSLTPLGYPRKEVQKPVNKSRKSIEEIVKFI